jgi:pyrroline-5-carboxylate reductase
MGWGVIGQVFVNQLIHSNYASKVYICDSNPKQARINSKVQCKLPSEVEWDRVDKVVIGVKNEAAVYEIRQRLNEMGVDEWKIVWRDYRYVNE